MVEQYFPGCAKGDQKRTGDNADLYGVELVERVK
jgi:hypothetical protein